MRLIDADALEEVFRKELDRVRTMDIPKGEEQYWDGFDEGICNGWVMVSDDAHFAPTIDAVEVVRCKDCKWYRDWDSCFFSTADVDAEDYCSYAERKEQTE